MSSAKPVRPIDTSLVISNLRLRKAYQLIQPSIERIFSFPQLWEHYDACAGLDAVSFAKKMLERLKVDWEVSDVDLEELRAIEGPLIVQSNHPFGGIDSFILIILLEKIRPKGWRLLSNFVIAATPECRDVLIPVDALGTGKDSSANAKALIRMMRMLKSDGVIGLFPAARVALWDDELDAVVDMPWTDHGLRLAEKTGATVVNLHISGHNSKRFLKIPTDWVKLRSLMLCREMVHPTFTNIQISLAKIYNSADIKRFRGRGQPGREMRADCFIKADLAQNHAQVSLLESTSVDTTATEPYTTQPEIKAAFNSLDKNLILEEAQGLRTYFFRGSEVPSEVMQELGRCREIAFRAAGQGVDSDIDLTEEDPYYDHLLLWDIEKEIIVGAYRLGNIQETISTRGASALYLDHIFKIQSDFYKELGAAYELSRSFIMPEYQKDPRGLASLWKGLGTAAVQNNVGTFFGSVTISNGHQPVSRGILVEYLKQNQADAPEVCALIEPRNPFKPDTSYHTLVADCYEGRPISSLSAKIEEIENGERGIPPLMRYYCSLGAKFLSYHVEPSFQDALYCLLRVDLKKMPSRYQKKFLGESFEE